MAGGPGAKEAAAVIIPARYASTRLPGKPLADIAGAPLIVRVYERARLIPGVVAVVVNIRKIQDFTIIKPDIVYGSHPRKN